MLPLSEFSPTFAAPPDRRASLIENRAPRNKNRDYAATRCSAEHPRWDQPTKPAQSPVVRAFHLPQSRGGSAQELVRSRLAAEENFHTSMRRSPRKGTPLVRDDMRPRLWKSALESQKFRQGPSSNALNAGLAAPLFGKIVAPAQAGDR